MEGNKRTYTITNCADSMLKKNYQLTEKEYEFLKWLFNDLNAETNKTGAYVGALDIEEA